MDELSLGAGTLVGELRDGAVREYELHPEDFGIAMAHSRNLRVADPARIEEVLLQALENREGLPREIVAPQRRRGAVRGQRGRRHRRGHRPRAQAIASGAAREAGRIRFHHPECSPETSA